MGVSPRWIDNVLQQHDVPGITSARQGVERAISDVGMRALELTRIANQELDIPIPRAAAIAAACVSQSDARFASSAGVELSFSLEIIDRRLHERLLDAIEATPRRRRGRPRKASIDE